MDWARRIEKSIIEYIHVASLASLGTTLCVRGKRDRTGEKRVSARHPPKKKNPRDSIVDRAVQRSLPQRTHRLSPSLSISDLRITFTSNKPANQLILSHRRNLHNQK